jgi:hypothetical protein
MVVKIILWFLGFTTLLVLYVIREVSKEHIASIYPKD